MKTYKYYRNAKKASAMGIQQARQDEIARLRNEVAAWRGTGLIFLRLFLKNL